MLVGSVVWSVKWEGKMDVLAGLVWLAIEDKFFARKLPFGLVTSTCADILLLLRLTIKIVVEI